MIPLPPGIKKKMLAWLPHVLAGYDYPMKETNNIVPDLIAPAITYYFSSVGQLSQFSAQPLRAVRNIDGTLDDFWGQYHTATLNVVLRSYNEKETENMWFDFCSKCLSTRRNAIIWADGFRFLEILDSKPLPHVRTKDGKDLYWAQVDLKFEYEVSSVPDEDFIKRANSDLQVGESDQHIIWTSGVKEVELTVGIVAFIVKPN